MAPESSDDRPPMPQKIPAPKGRNLCTNGERRSPFHAEPRHFQLLADSPISSLVVSGFKTLRPLPLYGRGRWRDHDQVHHLLEQMLAWRYLVSSRPCSPNTPTLEPRGYPPGRGASHWNFELVRKRVEAARYFCECVPPR